MTSFIFPSRNDTLVVANVAALPPNAANGQLAITIDTYNLYVFESGTGWMLLASPGGGGVTSLNGLTGAVTLAAGSNITLTPVGHTITIASSGGAPAGSTGSVQFNTSGAFAADASNFFWNSTTHRLGIGTASPSQSLHVVGNITSPGGTHSEKFGNGAVASASENTSLGYQATSTGNYSTAIGSTATTAATTDSVAVGYRAFVNSNQEVAIGSNSNATGLGSTAIGYNAHVNGDSSMSIGTGITSNTGQAAVLVGGNQSNSHNFVTAMGNNTFPQADNATILGYGAQVTGDGGVALGSQAYANATNAISIGHLVGNTFSGSIAIGSGSVVTAANQAVIGCPDLYLGGGSNAGSSSNSIHSVNSGAGNTNAGGSSLIIASGLSTGNAFGGDVVIQNSNSGPTSGTSQNTLSDRMRIYGDNGRALFTSLPDVPLPATSASGSILYANGTFYSGYATDGSSNRTYRLYTKKLDVSNAAYYSPSYLTFGGFSDNNSTVQATNPTGAAVNPTYGIGSGSYLADGTSRVYNVYAGGTVNGVTVINPSPTSAGLSASQNVTTGDPTLANSSQIGGGSYTPASTDVYSYNIYAHAVYNGVDIYSTFSAFTSVGLDGVTDPYQVVVTWTDATFPTGATVTDYTIAKQTNGGSDQYVTGVPVGGSFSDNDPALWTNGVATVSPTSTPDLYKNTITWTDPTFPVEIDPSSKFIQIVRNVAGGGFTEQLNTPIAFGVQTFDDTGNSQWGATPVTTPTTVQNYYHIPMSWTPPASASGYKMLYSPNNFASITTPGLTSFATPTQVDGSGSYGPNSDSYTYAITAYQTLGGIRVFGSGPNTQFFNAMNNGVPYSVQLDWVGPTFSPYATSQGYIIQRDINNAGYTDYRDAGNVITLLDDGTGWTTATPTLTPTSGQVILATDISGGSTSSFTDTGGLPWAASLTVTPTQAAATTVTVNPPGSALDLNGDYKFPAIPPSGANYILTSGAGTGDVMSWTSYNFNTIAGIIANGQLPFGSSSLGNILFSASGSLSTSSTTFDFGNLYHTMRVPTVFAYESGLQIGAGATSPYWQMYAPTGDFSFYNIHSGYGEVLRITDDSATDFILPRSQLKITQAGKGISIKEGTNAKMGLATLAAGTVVVNTTAVGANSRIFLTAQTLGTITVPVGLAVSARTAGTSFTILSGNLTDTSTVAWMIVDPA